MGDLEQVKVENIYNSLFKFEAGKRAKLYPIHKKLQFGNNVYFKGFNDISDWIVTNIKLNKSAKILDAGCGVGYVLLKLCRAYNCNGLGISLSNKEIEAAKANTTEQQLEKQCTFTVKNFDDLNGESFDLIIAIESIKHANNIEHTLKILRQNLKENGQIIIVEDYLSPAYSNHSLTKAFSYAWNVPIVYTESEFKNYCNKAQLFYTESVVLSSFLPKKNKILCYLKLLLLKASSKFALTTEKQTQLNIYKGALIMDYFYACGIFEYKLKVLQKL